MVLDYWWLLRLIPLAAYLLLLLAAIAFVKPCGPSTRYLLVVLTLGLAAALVYFNGLVSGAGWIAEGALFFTGCALIGFGIGYGVVFVRQGRPWLAFVHFALAVGVAAWWVISAGGLSGIASP